MADAFLHREVVKVPGYPDDFMETFEDYIDCFTPLENIVKICKIEFGMEYRDLDNFCNVVYNMNLKESYVYLLSKADNYMRKAITELSKMGNTKALDISATHFMKLGQDEAKANAKITINATIPLTNKGNGNYIGQSEGEDEE